MEDYRIDEMSMQNAAGESCSLASAAGYFCYYANLMHIYLKKKKNNKKNLFLFECAPYAILWGEKKSQSFKKSNHKCFMLPASEIPKKKKKSTEQYVSLFS